MQISSQDFANYVEDRVIGNKRAVIGYTDELGGLSQFVDITNVNISDGIFCLEMENGPFTYPLSGISKFLVDEEEDTATIVLKNDLELKICF